MKLLLVDDVELFLNLEKSFLDRKSFVTDTARSGKEALEKINRDKPDLVLLDLFMPEMNGDEVCRLIKGDPATRDIIVIMTSSESEDGGGVKERCFGAGCDEFLPKPIHRHTLLQIVEESLHLAKREHLRVPTHLPCTATRSGDTVNTWIHTIATGGVFVELTPPPDTGEEISVGFSLPGRPQVITVRAIVRWIRSPVDNGPAGAGVQFVNLSTRDTEWVSSYVRDRDRTLHPHRGA